MKASPLTSPSQRALGIAACAAIALFGWSLSSAAQDRSSGGAGDESGAPQRVVAAGDAAGLKQQGASPSSPPSAEAPASAGEGAPSKEIPAAPPLPEYPEPPDPSEGGLLPGYEPPTTPQLLAFRYDRPLTYSARGYHRLAIEEREEMKQVYQSAARVTYTPLQSASDRPEAIWGPAKIASEPPPVTLSLKPIEVHVEKAVGTYTYPELLADPARNHQIMRQATLTYFASPQGQLFDVQAHSPTHPLAKASVDSLSALLLLSQPIFPERPVQPGESWTQNVTYRDGEGLVQLSEDSTNTYTLERWRPCRRAMCAYITIKQDLRAAGRLLAKQDETRGTSIGAGEGWMLFDYERGEVVKSFMKIKGVGTVDALKKTASSDSLESQAKARVVVEYEISFDRVEDESLPPPLPVAPN